MWAGMDPAHFIILTLEITQMKIAGETITRELNTDVLVLPRGDDFVVVKAQAIAEMDEFEKLCIAPEAPGRLVAKKGFVKNEDDPTYKEQMKQYGMQRIGWIVINSLLDIEWDNVDYEVPKTWTKWETDMKDAGFSSGERNLVLGLVLTVNSLDEQKLEDARESFIQGQGAELEKSASQTDEQKSSPSGQPA